MKADRETVLHPALPKLPRRMTWLGVDARGYPVPWFVQWFHANGVPFERIDLPLRPGDYPDFRVVDRRKLWIAYKRKLCWVCGSDLGKYLAFVIGPMCAVNRTSGEPPSHRDCATFSARACPFLSKPQVERRENALPANVVVHPAMLARNPGVAMVWVTTSYEPSVSEGNVVFRIGDPVEVEFYCEGRPATRAEVMHSIDTGMPELRKVAEKQGPTALDELDHLYAEALVLVASATPNVPDEEQGAEP